jgi:hypothetical protein
MNEVLNIEQKDYICRQLAQFVPHKAIATKLLECFPEIKMERAELLAKIKYFSSHPNAKQWQERTEIYRSMLNAQLKKQFAFAHKFKRMRLLEKIIEQASTPRLAAVLSRPEERDDQGRMTYSTNEIYKADYATALRALTMINREMEQLTQGTHQPSPYNENLSTLSDEQLKERIETRQNIDAEFGPIQLNEDTTDANGHHGCQR